MRDQLLGFPSQDLTKAVYVSNDPGFPHVLADLCATPPVVVSRTAYFEFNPSMVNVQADTMIEARDGIPIVWGLADSESFQAGSREIEVEPYFETDLANTQWDLANETVVWNEMMAEGTV